MRSRLVVAGLVLALASACRKEEPVKPPPPTPSAPAGPSAKVAEAQAELFREVAAYVLQEIVVDRIAAVDTDLAKFWADPESAARIRNELSMARIEKAIQATPEFVASLRKHELSSRDYVLGTLSMIGGYSYEKVRIRDPKGTAGKKPPVTEQTLVVIRKRFADVEKIVRPKGQG